MSAENDTGLIIFERLRHNVPRMKWEWLQAEISCHKENRAIVGIIPIENLAGQSFTLEEGSYSVGTQLQ